MTRSRRWAVPAALGLAWACLLSPAAALAPADDEPVELGTQATDATVVEPGVHTLVLPGSDTEGYLEVERQLEGSTVWFAQTLLSDSMVNESVGMLVEDGGDSCPYGNFEGDDYSEHRFMTGIVAITPRCENGDTVTLKQDATSGFRAGGEEADLAVWEEPPAENREVLPPPSLEHAWVKKAPPAEGEAELGATYAEAPDLAGGRWKVHIDPGEPALFRVDLDWNQHLQVGFTYDGKAAGEELIQPTLITPLGGTSEWGEATDAPGGTSVMTSYPGLEGAVVSPSITWRNREARGVTAAFPGTYYVDMHMGAAKAPQSGADMTVSVQVVTDKDPESPYAPEHASSDAALPPDIGGHREDAETAASTEGDQAGATPWLAVGGLLAGAVVMAVAGGLSLTRYRRSLA